MANSHTLLRPLQMGLEMNDDNNDPKSAEAVTKNLRASTLGPQEKLAFAQRTWHARTFYVPGKDELLLDWVTSAMLRSIPKNNLGECKLEEETFLSVPYWNFFKDLCGYYVILRQKSLIEKKTTIRTMNPKTPLMPIFLSVITRISKGVDGIVGEQDDWVKLVTLVGSCFSVLTVELSDSFRPTLEQNVALSAEVIEALSVLLQNPGVNSPIVEAVGSLGCNVFTVLQKAQTQYANQKKIFMHTISKFFHPLIKLRHFLSKSDQLTNSDIQSRLDALTGGLLQQGLFHRDHMVEFGTVLQQSIGKKWTNGKGKEGTIGYPNQLFQHMGEVLKGCQSLDETMILFEAYPVILDQFLASRSKFLKSTSGTTSTFSPGFAFYRKLHDAVQQKTVELLEEATDENSGKIAARSLNRILEVIGSLLECLLKHEVYKMTNDDVSKQQLDFLKGLNGFLLETAKKIPAKRHATIFRSWRLLLSLDYTIIQDHMDDLWDFILLPHKSAEENAKQQVNALMDTFTKSRQLESFVAGILVAIRRSGLLEDVDRAQSSTVFSAECLEQFAFCIAALLPAQAIAVIRIIQDELLKFFMVAGTSETSTKKRKTGSTESVRTVADIESPVSITPKGAELPIILLSLTVRHARIAYGQRAVFDSLADGLYEKYIYPMLCQFEADGVKSKSRDLVSRSRDVLYPALSLHFALMEASDLYWEKHVNSSWVVKMLALSKAAAKVDSRVALLKNKISLYHVDRIASTTTDPSLEPHCTDVIGTVLNDMDFDSPDMTAEWDGHWPDLTPENLVVANWYSLTDHIAAVSRLATVEQMDKIVSVFVLSLGFVSQSSLPASSSISSISAQLSTSAAFHELRPIRDLFVQKLFFILSKHIDSGFTPSAGPDAELKAVVMGFLTAKGTDAITTHRQSLVTILSSPTETDMSSRMDLKILARCLTLIGCLNAFASQYFTPSERDAIAGFLFAFEVLVSRSHTRKGGQKRSLALLKCGAICRTLGMRFGHGKDDRLLLVFSPALLKWQLESLKDYANTYEEALTPEGLVWYQALVERTFELETLSCRKLLQRLSSTPYKGASCSPAEYIVAMLIFLRPLVKRIGGVKKVDLRWVIHFVQPILDLLEAKMARSHSTSDSHSVNSLGGDDFVSDVVSSTGPLGDVARELQSFLNKIEPKTMAVLTQFSASLTAKDANVDDVLGDSEACDRVGTAFDVFRLALRYRRLRAGENADSRKVFSDHLILLGSLMSETVTLLSDQRVAGDAGRTAVGLGQRFTVTFCEYMRTLDPPMPPSSIKNLVTLIWQLMRQSRILMPLNAREATTKASAALTCLVRDASRAQYNDILAMHIEELDKVPMHLGAGEGVQGAPWMDEVQLPVLTEAVSVVFATSNGEVGRRGVRKAMPRMVVKATQILQTTASLDVALSIIRLLTKISGDKFVDMIPSDLSLILNAVAVMGSRASCLRLESRVASPSGIENSPSSAAEVFDVVYRLLIALIRFRKEQLVDVIPAFVGLVKDLLFCFRADSSTAHATRTTTSAPFLPDPFPLLSHHAPLPESCADNLSRLFIAIGQKSTGATSTPSNPATTTTTPNAATATAKTVKPFSKHAPFLVASIVQIQTSLRPFSAASKVALLEGIYALLDVCEDHGREAVLAGLDANGGGRVVFKALVADWEKHHKYTGKA